MASCASAYTVPVRPGKIWQVTSFEVHAMPTWQLPKPSKGAGAAFGRAIVKGVSQKRNPTMGGFSSAFV